MTPSGPALAVLAVAALTLVTFWVLLAYALTLFRTRSAVPKSSK